MAATPSLNTNQIPNPIDRTQNQIVAYGTVALTGSYPANGDVVNFATLGIPTNQAPTCVIFYETTPAASGPPSLNTFQYSPGTTAANGKLVVSTGGVAFTPGAYGTPPFAITGFQLSFRAEFPFDV